jgi:hypothetical protein
MKTSTKAPQSSPKFFSFLSCFFALLRGWFSEEKNLIPRRVGTLFAFLALAALRKERE